MRWAPVYTGFPAVPVDVAAAPHRDSWPRYRLEIVFVAVVKTGCGRHFVNVAPPPGDIRAGDPGITMEVLNVYRGFSGKIVVMDVTRHGNPSSRFLS